MQIDLRNQVNKVLSKYLENVMMSEVKANALVDELVGLIVAQQSAEAVCTCISFGSDTAHLGVIMGDCPIHGTDKRYAVPAARNEEMMIDTIIQGDNVLVMRKLEDESIDLTVTSPPYDDLRKYNGFVFDFPSVAKELYRVTKQGGVVVWVVGDATVDGSETGTSFRQALYFMECGFRLHDTMIYEKNGSSLPDPTRYLQSFEHMFVFSKGKPKSFNPIKDRKNRFRERWGKGRVVREKDGSMSPRGNYHADEFGYRFNIWRYNTGAGYSTKDEYAFEHPAMFPEALANDHILSWSNTGDIVLDPFVGSGTTCKMAKQLGRHYIGIEISEEYCEIARKRVQAANVPLPLFT